MWFCGVDVAKYQHEACLLDQEGNEEFQLPFKNTREGLEKLLKAIRTLGISPEEIRFCLEATGHYWIALYSNLIDEGYTVHVINPIQSDALRNLYIRKAKTDRKDSMLLADLLRLGRAPKTELASETTLKLQTLSRMRTELVDQVSGLKNRVLAILDRIFPEYPDCFSDVFIRTSRELLKEYPNPEELAQADLSELSNFLSQHSRGRIGSHRAEQIQALAEGTFGIRLAQDAFTLQLKLLMEQIEFIQDQIRTVEEAMNQVMEELRSDPESEHRHVIETIPGIGPIIASAIIGEIGEIQRFPNAKALVAYVGIDATVKNSGEFEGTRCRMSKRGSPLLRRSFWQAAVGAIRFNPELKAYYEKKRAEGKHHKVAIGAVARRLVHLVHALWRDNRPFEPDYQWQPPENHS